MVGPALDINTDRWPDHDDVLLGIHYFSLEDFGLITIDFQWRLTEVLNVLSKFTEFPGS